MVGDKEKKEVVPCGEFGKVKRYLKKGKTLYVATIRREKGIEALTISENSSPDFSMTENENKNAGLVKLWWPLATIYHDDNITYIAEKPFKVWLVQKKLIVNSKPISSLDELMTLLQSN